MLFGAGGRGSRYHAGVSDAGLPLTRLARSSGWSPTPRRVGRAVRRNPWAAGFVAAAVLGVGWAAFPHARAAYAGHRLRYGGHVVTFAPRVPRRLRELAPLPAGSAWWTTPVAVTLRGDRTTLQMHAATPLLRRLETTPHVRDVSLVSLQVDGEAARLLAGRHAEPVLILHECDVRGGGLRPLAAAPGLRQLELTLCRLPAGELGAFAAVPTLRDIYLDGSVGVRGEAAALGGHPRLRLLAARGTGFGDEDLAALARCPALRGLLLDRTEVTDDGLAALRDAVPSLAALHARGTRISDAGLEAFGPHPAVRWLDLSGTAVTDAGLRSVVDSCPNLISLSLARTAVGDAGLDALAELDRLETLDLSGTAATDAILDRWDEWPALSAVELPLGATPTVRGYNGGKPPPKFWVSDGEAGLSVRLTYLVDDPP